MPTIDQRMDRLRQQLERHLNTSGLFINTRVTRAATRRSFTSDNTAHPLEELIAEEMPVYASAPEPKKKRKIILDNG